jgi:hypothetical protein
MNSSFKSIQKSFIIVISLYAASANAQSSDGQLKQELLKLEQTLNTSVEIHDTIALKQILATEYQLTGPRFPGSVRRRQWLDNVLKFSLDSASITDVTIFNWGEIAVFKSLQNFYMFNGEPAPFHDSRLTDLWIKRDGRWQLVTRLSERLEKK